MPHLTQPLSAGVPTIDAWIAISGLRAASFKKTSKSMPSPVRARLLIDTGATTTGLDPRLVQVLGVVPTGQAFMRTPSTGSNLHPCTTYDISLTIVHQASQLFLDDLAIFESDFAGQGLMASLGGVFWRRAF